MIKQVLLKTRFLAVIIILGSLTGVMGQKIYEKDTIKTQSGDLVITFLGHASLLFTYQGKEIYIDPVTHVADCSILPKADAILVTHEHGDHFDPVAIEKLTKPETQLFLTQLCYDKIKTGKVCLENKFYNACGIPVETVAAYNTTNIRGNGLPYHPKLQGIGYVFMIGGVKVYVAGDTELTQEMTDVKNIDIAFLPIGLPYTMAPGMAIEAAKMLKIKILYPYHFNTSNPEEILKAMAGYPIEVRLRSMK